MSRSHTVFGAVLIALGVLLFLDQAGYVSTWSVVASWWPLVVIAAGFVKATVRPRNAVGGAVLIGIGVVLLLWTLNVITSIAVVWPLLLIALGAWLLTRRLPQPASGELEPEMFLAFGDRKVRAAPGPFAGQAVTTLFGDVDVDLRDATIEERATLQVVTIFGDLDVEVPADWRVTVSGPELLSDVTVPTGLDLPADAPVLHLQVFSLFADVTVTALPTRARQPGT